MKKIFEEREIDAYINGEDIVDIDSYEANPYFMAAVIRKTKDYNTYAVGCDERIKLSPIIMKTMLEVFGNEYIEKDSRNFYRGLNILSKKSENIDNYYSDNRVVTTQFLEMLILLFKMDHSESDIVYEHFERDLKPYTDEYGILNDNCEGLFRSICKRYNSDIVQEYMAGKLTDKIINDVFYDGIDDLSYRGIECVIHNKITDKELLDEEMVICSIISCIAEVDTTLAQYLGEHKELLKEYGRYAKSYYEHWDDYEANKLFNTVDAFVSTVEKYFIEHQIDASSEDVVKVIGKKFGIESIFDDYYKELNKEKQLISNVEIELTTDDDLDQDKIRKMILETYRDRNYSQRVENMVNNNPIYRPLVSLARRTFVTNSENNKVLSLSSPITGGVSNK